MKVYLTDEQQMQVQPLLGKAGEAARAGEIGIVIAQVLGSSMTVSFIEHEWAKAIADVLKRRVEMKRAEASLAAKGQS
jgi:hypothetical protein